MRNGENNLQFICKNKEDLKIISAYSQDSIATVKDMVFLKKNKTFVMIVNRFMWEDALKENKRIRSAVKFEEVLQVKSKNINQKNKNKVLECLAIKSSEIFNQNHEINIFFAGDSAVTLIAEAIEVVMRDLGKPWKVRHVPAHKI